MRSTAFRSLPLVLAIAAVAACNPTTTPPATQPSGVTTAPLATATPVATASPTPSAAPSDLPSGLPSSGPGASAGPSLAPGVLFRDDFDGTEVDAARWTVYEKSGIVRVANGMLDLIPGGQTRDFPMVLANGDILPAEGPYYFEMSYTPRTIGRNIGFHLDYLPPAAADEESLTMPFMQGFSYERDLTFRFNGEKSLVNMWPKGDLKVDTPHRLRVEHDGSGGFRLIVDGTEQGTIQSNRRPRRFWMGEYPNKLIAPVNWMRFNIDYVEVGVLSERDPATPAPTTTPKPAG